MPPIRSIAEILPKKRNRNADNEANGRIDLAHEDHGYNECHDEFMTALSKAEVAVVPNEEELQRIIANNLCDCGITQDGERIPCPICQYYQGSIETCAKVIRTLLLGKESGG